ncbi:FeoA family protein [Luedemannella flava]|uniref:FeoA family protein n=1 Tax=Luedemannella flava TaxID=349316 RepID=A0ABN2LU45_9ACTN
MTTGPQNSSDRALADLAPGEQGRVVRVVAAVASIAGRMVDLGFSPGTPVAVVRRAPLGDPVVYRVKDYEVCLRRAQAACVQVTGADR